MASSISRVRRAEVADEPALLHEIPFTALRTLPKNELGSQPFRATDPHAEEGVPRALPARRFGTESRRLVARLDHFYLRTQTKDHLPGSEDGASEGTCDVLASPWTQPDGTVFEDNERRRCLVVGPFVLLSPSPWAPGRLR